MLCVLLFGIAIYFSTNNLLTTESNARVVEVINFPLYRNITIIVSLISLAISLVMTFVLLFYKKELISEDREKEVSKRNDQQSINNIEEIKTNNITNIILLSLIIVFVIFNIIVIIYKNKFFYKNNNYINEYINMYPKTDKKSSEFNIKKMNTIIDILREAQTNNLIKPIL